MITLQYGYEIKYFADIMYNFFIELVTNEWYLFILFFFSIIILISLSELALKQRLWTNNTNRKIIHITVGIAVSITPHIFITNIQPALLAFIFFILNLFSYKNNKLKSFHSIGRDSYGTIFFPLSYLLICIPFWDYPEHITISMMILAIADPFASIIGNITKKPISYNILGDQKTLLGSIGMFACSTIIVFILSNYFFNDWDIGFRIIAVISIGLAVTLAEALSYKGSDNLTIPVISFLFIELFNHIYQNDYMIKYYLVIPIIIFILFIAYSRKHLSISGFIGASIMAILLFGFGGEAYLYPLVIFFITSSILSQFKKNNIEIKHSNRSISQVYANGGVALIICIINYFFNHPLMYPCFLASVAAANSDTWGTELGKMSSKIPLDIISGQKVISGDSGGITLVGTIGSILGSSLIGLLGYSHGLEIKTIIIVIISGFLSSIVDSILGSTVQARHISKDGMIITEKYKKSFYLYTGSKNINNDIVNLYCTLAGPLVFLLYSIR